jgi:hypothetical protein
MLRYIALPVSMLLVYLMTQVTALVRVSLHTCCNDYYFGYVLFEVRALAEATVDNKHVTVYSK